MSAEAHAARRPPLRVVAALSLSTAVHAAVLLARVPVRASVPPEARTEVFELVGAVTLFSPPPPAPAAVLESAPAVAQVPSPVESPEPLPEVESGTEPESGAEVDQPGSSDRWSEAAVVSPRESGPSSWPEASEGIRAGSVLDPGTTLEPRAGAAAGIPAVSGSSGSVDAPDHYLPFYRVDVRPEFLRRGELRYPEAARRLGLTGTVVLEADIDETGTVRAVRVASSAGHGFDEAAVDMIRASTFSPARAGGRDMPVRARFTVSFRRR